MTKCANCQRMAEREARMMKSLDHIRDSLRAIEEALRPEAPIVAQTPEQEVALRRILGITVH